MQRKDGRSDETVKSTREEVVPPLICMYFSEPAKLEASLHLELRKSQSPSKGNSDHLSWDPAPNCFLKLWTSMPPKMAVGVGSWMAVSVQKTDIRVPLAEKKREKSSFAHIMLLLYILHSLHKIGF